MSYNVPEDSFNETNFLPEQILHSYENIYGMTYIVNNLPSKNYCIVFVEGSKFNKQGKDDGCWWRKAVVMGPFDLTQLLKEVAK